MAGVKIEQKAGVKKRAVKSNIEIINHNSSREREKESFEIGTKNDRLGGRQITANRGADASTWPRH